MSQDQSARGGAGTTGQRQLVSCARCGAPVPELDLAQSSLHCNNCGAVIVVPDAMRARALAYVSEMQTVEQRVASAVRSEAAADRLTATVKRSRFGVWLLIWMTVVVPLSMFGLYCGLPLLGFESPRLVGQIMYGAALFLTLAPIPGFFVLSRRRSDEPSNTRGPPLVPRPALSVQCQECGAPIVFEPGVVSQQCAYCRTANVAPATVANPMLEWASKNALSAEKVRAKSQQRAEVAVGQAETASNRVMGVFRIARALVPAAFLLTIGFAFINDGSRADERGAWIFIALGVIWLIGVGLRALLRR
jgi:ribosomal protein S27E